MLKLVLTTFNSRPHCPIGEVVTLGMEKEIDEVAHKLVKQIQNKKQWFLNKKTTQSLKRKGGFHFRCKWLCSSRKRTRFEERRGDLCHSLPSATFAHDYG